MITLILWEPMELVTLLLGVPRALAVFTYNSGSTTGVGNMLCRHRGRYVSRGTRSVYLVIGCIRPEELVDIRQLQLDARRPCMRGLIT